MNVSKSNALETYSTNDNANVYMIEKLLFHFDRAGAQTREFMIFELSRNTDFSSVNTEYNLSDVYR